GVVISLWVSGVVEQRLMRTTTGESNVHAVLVKLFRALLLLIAVLIALSVAGLDLTVLSVFGGALGVGIGFGLQKLASNYISGFVVLAERSLHIGDWVKVDGFEGRITDISTRFTVIRARDGREANVPNEMLITQRVENATRADPRVALTTAVTIERDADIAGLLPLLADAVRAAPLVVAEPA